MPKSPYTIELLRIAKSEAVFGGHFEDALKENTEAAARALGIERVSIWFYNADHSRIHCANIFEKSKGTHQSGIELSAKDYPSYFRALESERIIDASDAHNDERTREFSASYLTPLGIGSLLDAPIRTGGKMIGVVCHEHIGPPREWSLEDASFGGSMADFVAVAGECRNRVLAERALRKEVAARVSRERLAALGEMSAVIAHEVRNPVGAILNSVSCLRRMVPARDDVESLLTVLQEESQRLIALTDNLLDVARPVETRMQSYQLAPILEEAIAAVRRQPDYAERELPIDAPTVGDDMKVFSDAKLLHRVMVNLVTNAVEATGDDGRVQITAEALPDDMICLSFSNPGEALPAELASRIFEPFFTTKPVGSGLGLAIVRRLMTTLGGRVELDATSNLITFSIFIPTRPKTTSVPPPWA